MAQPQRKSLDTPDRVLNMDFGKIDIVEIAGGGVGRATFQPGWKWSDHEKPYVNGGDYCQVPHFVFLAAGRLHVVFADGEEMISSRGMSPRFRPVTMVGL